jgi:hypothetical protein
MRIVNAGLVLGVCCVLAGCGAASPQAPVMGRIYDAAFWETWGDGFAEVSTYDLVMPRYGANRDGESILIFVSETFSNRQRVKADPGKNPKADEFPVMKVNWQKNFQTGIYDYSEMTSAFLGLAAVDGRAAGTLAKVAFTRQEWCGQMFVQALFDAPRVRVAGSSYFDGDGDLTQTLPVPAKGLSEDGLVFWARGMAGPFLKPGESVEAPFLTGLRSARDAHQPLAWSRVNLARGTTTQKVETAAGEFVTDIYAANLANGKGYLFFVESDAPHRLIRWQFSSGETGELYASERVKYWELNRPEGVDALRQLGLEPRAPRFAPEE